MSDPNNAVVNYQERMMQMAEGAASKEHVGTGRSLSTSGGILSFDDTPMLGNQVAAIILTSIFENTYYTGRYVPGGPIESPKCYAMGFEEEGLGPHPSMQADLSYFQPQGSSCVTCPFNEWGSATTGRGKACQQRRRLAMVPAGAYMPSANGGFDLNLFNDPQVIKTADLTTLKTPVTSVKNWAKYVNMLNAEYQRPPAGVITRIYLEQDSHTQFKVNFEVIDLVPDDMLEAVFARMDEANNNIIQPYTPPDPEQRNHGAHQVNALR